MPVYLLVCAQPVALRPWTRWANLGLNKYHTASVGDYVWVPLELIWIYREPGEIFKVASAWKILYSSDRTGKCIPKRKYRVYIFHLRELYTGTCEWRNRKRRRKSAPSPNLIYGFFPLFFVFRLVDKGVKSVDSSPQWFHKSMPHSDLASAIKNHLSFAMHLYLWWCLTATQLYSKNECAQSWRSEI